MFFRSFLVASLLAGAPQARLQNPPPPPAPPGPPALPPSQGRGAQADPVAGNWRGTLTSAPGVDSPIIITIAKRNDTYFGSTSGMTATAEIPLKTIAVTGTRVTIEAASESRLGDVTLTGDLTVEGASMKGAGTLGVGGQHFDVAFALQRRPRAEVIQPQVEQKIDYFAGRWTFEYLGAEYPPLSAGSRTGAVTFTRTGASTFVTGKLDGEVAGKAYSESLAIGLDPETNMLVFQERHANGTELVSIGNWRSPIGITFVTSPVQANGKLYQLRRFIHVTSPVAFEMTEEFSIDGGPYRRLGNAHFTKKP
ncbi:MAG: hypothetical protein HY047_05860 [Acidobacteria bacterium]|nr:hypothetical protein [Acidobacteriota bacterium]